MMAHSDDSATVLENADQRYYASNFGRFMSPDPYQSNVGGPGDGGEPGSWNPYSYTRSDPVNRIDPPGLDDCNPAEDPNCAPPGSGPPITFPGGTPGSGGCPLKGPCVPPKPPKQPNCYQVAAGTPPNNPTGAAGTLANGLFGFGNTLESAINDMDALVQQTLSTAQMTWEFFSGRGPESRTFDPTSVESVAMSESILFSQAMALYLSNPNNPNYQQGTMEFGAMAVIAAGVNPVQQFVGSFYYTINPNANGGLNVTITNTTSYTSLMRFIQYFGLTPPDSWTRGQFPIMGNIDQTFNLVIPCPPPPHN